MRNKFETIKDKMTHKVKRLSKVYYYILYLERLRFDIIARDFKNNIILNCTFALKKLSLQLI